RFPARLLDRLNREEDSPLKGLIRTPTSPAGVIRDNSLLKMLEHSISDGVLYRIRDAKTGEADEQGMVALLKDFWAAVRSVFHEDWQKPPRQSRLMHGAGVVSLGLIMDAVADRYRPLRFPDREDFETDLQHLKTVCRWSEGHWDFGPLMQRKWNEVQNTHRD